MSTDILMLRHLIQAAILHNGRLQTNADYSAAADRVSDMLYRGGHLAAPAGGAEPVSISEAEAMAALVPLRIEYEPGYPEDVAFGTQMQMDRLKLWLDKHFAALCEPGPTCWVVEHGAVSLPIGSPSRITTMERYETPEAAMAEIGRQASDALTTIGGTPVDTASPEYQRLNVAAPVAQQPAELTDERIDYIADLVVKGMPEGIQGFLKSWGWRQFARAILKDCAGHYAAPALTSPQPAEPVNRQLFDALQALHNHCEKLKSQLDAVPPANRSACPISQGLTWHLATATRALQDASAPTAQQPEELGVTPEMITAYLQANDAYWHDADSMPFNISDPSKWRSGTPREATLVGLRAALALATPAPVAQQQAELSQIALELLSALKGLVREGAAGVASPGRLKIAREAIIKAQGGSQ